MGDLKVLFVFLLFWNIDSSTSQSCTTCGTFDRNRFDITDESTILYTYENFNNLIDVSIESCPDVPGAEYIYTDVINDESFTMNLDVKAFEEGTLNEDGIKVLCVNIVADCGCQQRQDNVFIFVTDTNNNDPFFIDENGNPKSEYTYTIPMPSFPSHDINNLGVAIRAKDIDTTNMIITFEIEDNEDIEIISKGIDQSDPLSKTHYSTLNLKRMLYYTQDVTYGIKAIDKGGKKADAQLVIKSKLDEVITTNTFKQPHYEGTCNDQGVCVTDIKLTDGSTNIEIIKGDSKIQWDRFFSSNFSPKLNGTMRLNTIQRNKSSDFLYLTYKNDHAFDIGDYIDHFEFDKGSGSINLVGNVEDIKDEMVILLLESKPDSQLVPVNAIASVTVPLGSGEEPEPDPVITFEDHPESLPVKTTATPLDLWTFKAVSTDRWDTIEYHLTGDVPGGVFLNKDSGKLSIVDSVSSGFHTLEIMAKGDISKQETTTSIILNVLNFEIGDDDEVHITQFFTSMKINENADRTKILLFDNELTALGYKYEIIYQNPDHGLFNIIDGDVVSETLDREADYFKDVNLPQFTLLVELTKEDQMRKSNHTRNSRSLTKGYEVIEGINMFENLEYHPRRTAVVVVVKDVNDHTPEFGMDKLTVCYPKEDIVDAVKPSYLAQVKAIDLDSPDGDGFGKIAYSTNSEAIMVNEISGVIYPTQAIYNQETTTVMVTATDGGGKKADLEIKVVLVGSDQIADLSMANVELQDLELELEKLSTKTGLKIGTFTLPMISPQVSTSRANGLKSWLYIYALDNDVPVTTNKMTELLETEDNVVVAPFQPNGGSGSGSSGGEDEQPVGYIVAVSILSVLLVAFICATAAFWYFKLRPKQLDMYSNDKEGDEETPSTEEKITRFEKNNNALQSPQSLPMRRPTGFPFADSRLMDETNDNASLTISMDKTHDHLDSTSNGVIPNQSITGNDDENNNSNTRERKKSVTFRGAIEKIAIEKSGNDEEEEDSSDSDSEEERRKSVKFKGAIEKIAIEKSGNDDEEDSSSSDSEDDVKKGGSDSEDDDKKKDDSSSSDSVDDKPKSNEEEKKKEDEVTTKKEESKVSDADLIFGY